MASSKTTDGTITVKEGSLYWKLDVPNSKTNGPSASSKPTLFFMHSGVTDHTAWDAQVAHLLPLGWSSLRCDRFGYGKSHASGEFLASDSKKPVDQVAHMKQLVTEVLGSSAKVVVIGLSMGGGAALDFATECPELVAGLVVAAGGVADVGKPNDPREDALFEEADALMKAGDVQRAAKLQSRIWADGPLQKEGRVSEALTAKMIAYNVDIVQREIAKTGGFNEVQRSPQTDKVRVPTAIAYGTFDETYTTTAMLYLGEHIKGATIKEFPTAHMINLEVEDEFSSWLQEFLDSNY